MVDLFGLSLRAVAWVQHCGATRVFRHWFTLCDGSPPLVAGHVAVIKGCQPPLRVARTQDLGVRDVRSDPFEVLALGSRCIMDGTSYGSDFRPDYGSTCSLRFAEGAHTLRVTDVSLQFGITAAPYGAPRGGAWTDPGIVQIEIGGTDATTGTRAVYHFSGTAVDEASVFPSCDDEIAKRGGPSADAR